MVIVYVVTVILALFSTCRLEHTKDRRLLLHSDVDIQQVLDELRRDIGVNKQEINTQKAHMQQEINVQRAQFEQELNATKQDSLAQKAQLENEIGALRTEVVQLRKGQGSTYVRWGRTTCSAIGTEKVYSGFAAGSEYNTAGGAASTICLPESPSWAYYVDGVQSFGGMIYGTEYELNSDSFSQHAFGKNMHDEDVPCALCHSPRPATVMIPGTTSCFRGWTLEYTGYLMTNHYTAKGGSDYTCVDKDPEAVYHGEGNTNGHIFYFTEVQCGTLPCQEYPDGRELACVVCSK